MVNMTENRLIRYVQYKDAVRLLAELNRLGKDAVHDNQDAEAALCLAAEAGYEGCTRVLLDYGIDRNCEDYKGDTPLTLATRGNHCLIVKILLENGADVFQRNRQSETSLDVASEMGQHKIIDLLLYYIKRCALIGKPSHLTHIEWDMFCYTPLVSACDSGNKASLKKLIDAGFDINLSVIEEVGTPLHAAIDAGSVACAALLIESGADIEALRPCQQQSPLAACAETNQVEISKMLLAAGCDIDRQTDECSNALTVACHYGCCEMAQFLLGEGADPNRINPWGFTSLYMAVDSLSILKRLLKENVDVNTLCGDRGEGAIHLAAVIGDITAVTELLCAGGDINLRTSVNENALWLSVWKGHVELIKFLISRNCDMNVPSNSCQVFAWDYLPLEVALGSGNYAIAKLLVISGCSLRNRVYYPEHKHLNGPLIEVPWLQIREETVIPISKEPREKQWLVNYLRNPVSLKHSCRLAIRRVLGVNIIASVHKLPLPGIIGSYLMLSDL